jgi:hypothetical protein
VIVKTASVLAVCCSLVPALPVALAPMPAHAFSPQLPHAFKKKKKKKPKPKKEVYTPQMAAERRGHIEAEAKARADGGDVPGSALVYDRGASEKGDPVLYLAAGDVYLELAKKDGDEEMAQAAIERGRIAQDILFFHLDSAADEDFRLVETSEVPTLLARADDLVQEGETTLQQIQSAADPTGTPAGAPPPKKKGNGKGMIVGGLVLASAGGGLAVMGVAGLALGAVNQNKAEDPTIYGEAYDDVESKGKRANLLAGVGLGLGAACIAGGVVLYLLGKRRQKRAAEGDKVVMVSPTLTGLAVTGRF